MNAMTAILSAALALAVFLALRSIRKDRRSGCHGTCSHCAGSCLKQ